MTLSPFFNTINGFTTIQVPAAVGGSGLGGGAASINGTIQLPQFTTMRLDHGHRPRRRHGAARRCEAAQ